MGGGLLLLLLIGLPTEAKTVLSDVIQVDAGDNHTCALTRSGGVKCWGSNSKGELGDGSYTNRSTAVDVVGLGSGVVAVTAGRQHSCALTSAGGVKCWGDNFYGQLGTGNKIERLGVLDVLGLTSGFVAISAGDRHTCALTASGGVKCWGDNGVTQLGDGSRIERSSAVDVYGLDSGVVAIAAGAEHTCALTGGGGVKCWGSDSAGQLGDGPAPPGYMPVDVVGLSSGVTAITAGGGHTCALTSIGEMRCWGSNWRNQLGDGTLTSRDIPGSVGRLGSSVVAIAAGRAHTCAVVVSGGVRCWGASDYGQLGEGYTSSHTEIVTVEGLGGAAVSISAGDYHGCALTQSSEVKCWGYNGYDGTIGVAVAGDYVSSEPITANGLLATVNRIAAGGQHTCAVIQSGSAKCWGANQHGQIGDGTSIRRVVAVDVIGLNSGISGIVAGYRHSCAVGIGGEVMCWGSNDYGQLGNSNRADALTAINVAGLGGGVKAIAIGDFHTCALTSSGGVKCWGQNQSGQLGDSSVQNQTAAVDVVGLASGVAAIAAGSEHSCALTSAGGVKCWGANGSGQLGDGSTTLSRTAIHVAGLSAGVSAIAAGDYHTCALTSGGGVKCWGGNQNGQLGDGTAIDRSVAVDVVGLGSGVVAISAGGFHTCALTSGGSVKCWGSDWEGQLGHGFGYVGLGHSTTPVDVPGLQSGVTGISAKYLHTCAVSNGGRVTCWGDNSDGQLGNGLEGSYGLGQGAVFVSACGVANLRPVSFAPDTGLCVAGAIGSKASGSGPWTWTCTDASGVAENCSAPLKGECGAATRLPPQLERPTSNLCAVGSIGSDLSTGYASFGWNCRGSGEDGTTSYCATPRGYSVTAIAGPNGSISPTQAVVGWNTPFTFTVQPDSGFEAWVSGCQGSMKDATTFTVVGTTGECQITAKFGHAGRCGSAHLSSAIVAPSSNLCSSGQASMVDFNGQWHWACIGSEPIFNASCAAYPAHPITRYYQSILERTPDEGGVTFWNGEVGRMLGLGAELSEAYLAMARYFFTSPEFIERNLDDEGFVRVLYATFVGRTADQGGLDYWKGQIAAGLPRDMVMYAFTFSPEFKNFMTLTLGNTPRRAEVRAVIDYYRGAFGRLPDTLGHKYWVNRFRTAQCSSNPTGAVYQAAIDIAGAFYGGSDYWTNPAAVTPKKYVADLYNGFMRRGADLEGFNYWVNALAANNPGHTAMRKSFIDTPEFASRVKAIVDEGCTTLMQ